MPLLPATRNAKGEHETNLRRKFIPRGITRCLTRWPSLDNLHYERRAVGPKGRLP
jgi:hypothetical protein